MKRNTALAWAVPVWMVVCGAMVAINYAAEARATLFNLSLGLLATYPLAIIIKMTAEDWARWRAAYGSSTDENIADRLLDVDRILSGRR